MLQHPHLIETLARDRRIRATATAARHRLLVGRRSFNTRADRRTESIEGGARTCKAPNSAAA
jgi:hypothetical protein